MEKNVELMNSILKKHLDRNNIEMTRKYYWYLHDAMQEWSDLQNKEAYNKGYEDGANAAANDILNKA